MRTARACGPTAGHGTTTRRKRQGWPLGLALFGLFTCSQPAVLRAPLAEPEMVGGPVTPNPLPAIAEPTGGPAIERMPSPDAS